MLSETLLILPCNPCVKLGDYSMCSNWRIVLKYISDLVSSGLLDLAAVDSCKPGVVMWGEESYLRWCDRSPRWDKTYGRDELRLELLVDAIRRDLSQLRPLYRLLIYYVNVRAYHHALIRASRSLGFREEQDYVDLSPGYNPLVYRSSKNLEALRRTIISLHIG